MTALAIGDRTSFQHALTAARADTLANFQDQTDPLGRRILADLDSIERCVARGLVDAEDTRAIMLGPLSERLTGEAQIARRLAEIDYAFRRYRALAVTPPPPSVAPDVRRGIVQIRYGRRVFEKRILAPGERLVIGRNELADLVLGKDEALAGRHVEIWWDGVVAQVRALTDAMILVNGQPSWRGELENGGVLVAGRSTLRFFVEAFSPPREPASPSATMADARARLLEPWQAQRLYGVVDAARSARALQLLEEATDDHASLYEGELGRGLDAEAPYLVRFDPTSGLFDRMLVEGWGSGWGIFLVSDAAPKMVRRSLRRLLMVDADTRDGRLYFRFYDPRAFGRFAPLTTARQRSEILSDAEAVVYEDADGAPQSFARQEASA
jgi:Domain of unknown function (DUF4123)